MGFRLGAGKWSRSSRIRIARCRVISRPSSERGISKCASASCSAWVKCGWNGGKGGESREAGVWARRLRGYGEGDEVGGSRTPGNLGRWVGKDAGLDKKTLGWEKM